VYSVSDPLEVSDRAYTARLRSAVTVGLDYALEAMCSNRPLPAPPELLAQARLAARSGVSLDTVLRRYFAGFALLGDSLFQETQADSLDPGALQRTMAGLSSSLDRLVAAVSDEHSRAATSSPEERKASHVRRLLAGEFLDASEFAYNLDAHHLGLVAAGTGLEEVLREFAERLDRRLLSVTPEPETQWAWFGSAREADPEALQHLIDDHWPQKVKLSIGEPAEGIEGWRLTHRQAKAALPVAQRLPEPSVRYADVALLSSIIQDELLTTSLRQLYLQPLCAERDGGENLRETLRAYFAAGNNLSSAAAALGVTRKTAANRLRLVEERIGRSLGVCASDLEVALRLAELPR
jgi:PucR C-terminal helix-turn-helix domain/GGDEF-like domain